MSQSAWDDALASQASTSHQQSYGYGAVVERLGGGVHRAEIFVDGSLVAIAQLNTKKMFGVMTIATIMLGPVWLKESVPATVQADIFDEIARTAPLPPRSIVVLIPPVDGVTRAEALAPFHRVVSGYHTVQIDLRPDEETLRAQLTGKWRNRLNASEKSNLRFLSIGKRPNQYEWLLTEERRQQIKRRYRAFDPGLLPLYQDIAGPKSLFALEARSGDERVAAMLFVRHGQTATQMIGWANDTGRSTSAQNLLLWQSIVQLKKKGVSCLDLGGVHTDEGEGLIRFKLGTGGHIISQPGSYLLSPKLR